jgi:hypothetical protein
LGQALPGDTVVIAGDHRAPGERPIAHERLFIRELLYTRCAKTLVASAAA